MCSAKSTTRNVPSSTRKRTLVFSNFWTRYRMCRLVCIANLQESPAHIDGVLSWGPQEEALPTGCRFAKCCFVFCHSTRGLHWLEQLNSFLSCIAGGPIAQVPRSQPIQGQSLLRLTLVSLSQFRNTQYKKGRDGRLGVDFFRSVLLRNLTHWNAA